MKLNIPNTGEVADMELLDRFPGHTLACKARMGFDCNCTPSGTTPKDEPTLIPWLVVADGEGCADSRVCRTHAEIVQFLWEQCGHDWTGDEQHARNSWFTYLEDGDNWSSRDGVPQFRCEFGVGETGHILIQSFARSLDSALKACGV